MRERVEYLASPELEGRAPGSVGGRLAREFVTEAFGQIGLEPAGDDGAYAHWIPGIGGEGGSNLIGAIPGHGPNADRYLMVAAHYDHLGIYYGDIYPGADDNAAAVAVLLDVAERLTTTDRLGRTVLICSFDAEEPPHFLTDTMGSVHWVDRPTVPLDRLDAFVCFDLVGRSLGPDHLPDDVRHSVFVLGAERTGLASVVDDARNPNLMPRRINADVVPPLSDHFAFEEAGIPFLFYTTGRDRHYHTPTDTPERLDYGRMVGLADHLTDVVCALADGPTPTYDHYAHDDGATLRSIVEIGEHAIPLHPEADYLMQHLGRFQRILDDGTPLTRLDRALLSEGILRIEEALG